MRKDSRTNVSARAHLNTHEKTGDEAIYEIKGMMEHAKRITGEAARKLAALRNGRPTAEISRLSQAYVVAATVTDSLAKARDLLDDAITVKGKRR